MSLRWKYLHATDCSVEVGGQVLPVKGGFLPCNLPLRVVQALEESPHFQLVPWAAPPEPASKAKTTKR